MSRPKKAAVAITPARLQRLNRTKWICLVLVGVIFWLDRLTKHFAILYLKPVGHAPLLSPIFHLEWVTNKGAAWGNFAGQWWLLVGFTALMLGVITFAVLRNWVKDPVLMVMLSFFVAGGLGNLADRMVWGYVVDFLAFSFFEFPVFNVADMAISVTAFAAVLYILFFEEKHRKHLDLLDGMTAEAPTDPSVEAALLSGEEASNEPL